MPRQHHRLSAVKLGHLPPGLHADGDNLYLKVTPTLSRSWIFRYEVAGKPADMGLGGHPPISLSQARRLAAECREHLLRGDDPLALRRARQAQTRAEREARITFKDLAEEFLKVHLDTFKNDKHQKQWRSTLEQHAYPHLGRLSVTEIGGADITAALSAIWMKTPETAKRTRQRIDRVLQWGKDGKPLPQHGAAQKRGHHAAMPFAEVPAYVQKLRKRASVSAIATEFTILTAARTGETIGATWDEFDLDAGVWTIPAGRMKGKREHDVPLSERVLEILHALPRERGNPYVFTGREAKPLSNMAMLELVRGTAGNGYTMHGFRSSFRDWAGDRTNFPREVIEHALAHQIKDKAEAAYRRSSALEKRRKLMEAWAQYLDRPAESGNVTQMLRRA
jgi:integrase